MAAHEPNPKRSWDPDCDYIRPREELVSAILQQVLTYGVVVIRATPQVGKTVLLKRLGYHIVYAQPDLEPVYLPWEDRERRKELPYEGYLQQHQEREREWVRKNAELCPRNPAARTIFLIDEAQGLYEEETFWSTLKNYYNTRTRALYLLVCVYGATGI
jgi:predicted AAA+ superfamily ATPase